MSFSHKSTNFKWVLFILSTNMSKGSFIYIFFLFVHTRQDTNVGITHTYTPQTTTYELRMVRPLLMVLTFYVYIFDSKYDIKRSTTQPKLDMTVVEPITSITPLPHDSTYYVP